MLTIILIIILTTINAIFAASEMALVSISPSTMYQLKQNNDKSRILEKVTKDSTKYLSTIQVAITFAGFLSSAFAGSQLSGDLIVIFDNLGIRISNSLSVIIITVLLSFFTLVFGELVPKRIALSKSIKIALLTAPIIYVVMLAFTPFVWLLTNTTRLVVRLFGIKNTREEEITEKEIKEMIVFGHIEGLYQEDEKDMMQRIFMFDDITVDEIMTPLEIVPMIDVSNTDDEIIDIITSSKFSRIPVYENTKENIIGVLLIKDVLHQIYETRTTDIEIRDILIKPSFINDESKINELFRLMKEEQYHLAFIQNKEKEAVGIVTFEDIIEEIVGDIYDEHDS